MAPCSLWDGLSQVVFVCQPPRTNKSSRVANGILGKKVRNYVYIPRPKFPFQITLTGRELAAWTGGGAALEFTANPDGQPAVLSFLADCRTGKRPTDDCGLCAVQGSDSASESFRLTFILTSKRGASCRTQERPTSKTPIVPYQPSC